MVEGQAGLKTSNVVVVEGLYQLHMCRLNTPAAHAFSTEHGKRWGKEAQTSNWYEILFVYSTD